VGLISLSDDRVHATLVLGENFTNLESLETEVDSVPYLWVVWECEGVGLIDSINQSWVVTGTNVQLGLSGILVVAANEGSICSVADLKQPLDGVWSALSVDLIKEDFYQSLAKSSETNGTSLGFKSVQPCVVDDSVDAQVFDTL